MDKQYSIIMKGLSKYVKKQIDISFADKEHKLNEMARIDDPNHDRIPHNVKIYVYSENDEQATKTPHFHVIGETFEFEVYIEHIHKLNIWRTKFINKKSNKNTWIGNRDIKDAIIKWLDKPNIDFNPLTNASVIVAQWNSNNPSHKISQEFKD